MLEGAVVGSEDSLLLGETVVGSEDFLVNQSFSCFLLTIIT